MVTERAQIPVTNSGKLALVQSAVLSSFCNFEQRTEQKQARSTNNYRADINAVRPVDNEQ